ncbi:MAG: FHA domain-containing protein [Planctomyces sp.]|nr:FHA domain-containing protein [Planctomyces sp.]
MPLLTFQVLDGLEMGHVFEDLPTPISIGREEDNHIRLNDERVSRFHAKVQEDAGRIILTDLDSTNGTRVNGHPIRIRILQIGDQILIGRCMMLYGSPEQMAERTRQVREVERSEPEAATDTISGEAQPEGEKSDLPGDLFPDGAPPVPADLTLSQTAEVSEMISFVHSRLLNILLLAQQQGGASRKLQAAWMTVPPSAWMTVSQLEADLAKYLRELADPRSVG